jgi:hypothetical protein
MFTMKRIGPSIILLALAAGCAEQPAPDAPARQGAPPIAAPAPAPKAKQSLADARRGFATKPGGPQAPGMVVWEPPPGLFRMIKYPSPVGDLSAYLTPDPGDGQKYPAIVWIHGGDSNSIGRIWWPEPRENDQTAAAYLAS